MNADSPHNEPIRSRETAAPSAPRRSIIRLNARSRRFLVDRPYRSLLGIVTAGIGILGGLSVVLQNFLPSALICIAVIAFFLWLRGEALLDAWAAVSDSRQQLLEETGKQRRALDALTRRHGHIVHFTERQVIRHWIGDQEDEDRTDYELTTTAASGQSVLWRTIHVRSDSKSSSFREIQFDISSVLPEDGFSIEFIPLSEKAGDLRGMAIFLPEIREDPRKWRYSHRWKGMWNPLRNNLRDNATYHLQVAGMISSIEIQFIFPRTVLEASFFSHRRVRYV
jgi:hypothetical protein